MTPWRVLREDAGDAAWNMAVDEAILDSYVHGRRRAPTLRLYGWAVPSISLGRHQVPTEVLWGGRDPFFDVAQGRRTAEQIPGSTFTVLEGCGHFVPEERPEALATRILALAHA